MSLIDKINESKIKKTPKKQPKKKEEAPLHLMLYFCIGMFIILRLILNGFFDH